jgi:hypothetical protein
MSVFLRQVSTYNTRAADVARRTEKLLGCDQQVCDRLFDLRELLLGLRGITSQRLDHGVHWARVAQDGLTFLGVRRWDPCEERMEGASSVMVR